MAHKLILQKPFQGMGFIWNVSAHVGCKASCPNRPTDVELVKFLFREYLKRQTFQRLKPTCSSPPITLNGSFDAILGFWIYSTEDWPGATSDGVISPARGMTYGPGGLWVISLLNGNLFKAAPDFWAGIGQNSELSPALRAELAKTSP
jgi:hypothetical protein